MKISKIKISKFHQFEDFELDLTYPKGHEKAGKPLDKVCFIGQSGTGKTTILELIQQAVHNSIHSPRYDYKRIKFEAKKGVGAIFIFKSENEEIDFNISIDANGAGMNQNRLEKPPIVNALFYFSTGLAQTNIQVETSDIIYAEEPNVNFEENGNLFHYYPISHDTLQAIWNGFYKFIKEYQQDEANFRINLTRRYEKEKIDISKEIDDWKSNNSNPLESVANECLDIILNKFNLAVQTEIEDINKLNALQIRSLSEGVTIPYEHLSTGTKQIIFTAFPIYQLLEDDSIVLMDEPETSLYPDIQREIIPYYTSFDKNKTSQFFFATHSPIIASAFEPWEIVELKFDEKGKVYRDKYYEGENHVDNYRLDAQILRYDQILTRIFDLSGDSDAKRAEKLQELSILKKKVEKLKKEEMEKPSAETQKIINEYLQLSDDISGTWALSRHEKN